MKTNGFMLLVSLVIGGMIFMGLHTWENGLLYEIGTAFVGFLLLLFATGISIEGAPRGSSLLKIVSGIGFIIMLPTDIGMTHCMVSTTAFVIVNVVALCIWASVVYGLVKSKQ